MGFPGDSDGKESPFSETWVQSQGWEDPLEKRMATHSSILIWRIPMDRGAWWARVHGVAKSRTQLSNLNQTDRVLEQFKKLNAVCWKSPFVLFLASIGLPWWLRW